MTKPLFLDDFTRLSAGVRATMVDGLSAAIDRVAAAAAPSHRFLRYQWFAAAVAAYGGHPRTIVVADDGAPVFALPLVSFGPAWARLLRVPGCYWPFRSAPIAEAAGHRRAARCAGAAGDQGERPAHRPRP